MFSLNKYLRENILQLILLPAAVIYTVTAYNSHGYYHADEHYQIIEFAGLSLGTHTSQDMAWEHAAKMRPSLQPILCSLLISLSEKTGITNPYNQTFILRLITAVLAIISITFFINSTRSRIQSKTDRTVYYLLSYFLWFIPVLSVRFSSETWSGLIFLSALALFLNKSEYRLKPFSIGILLGLSFYMRFQIAFSILGFGMWVLIFHPSGFKYILKTGAAFTLILLFGFFLDYWFYGELVFTPWNYFNKNLVEGIAASFSTSPWYYYPVKILSTPTYFIGIPILAAYMIYLISKPRDILIWITLPFLIGHTLILHKEIRFLFPMIYLCPLIMIESYIRLKEWLSRDILIKTLNTILLLIFIIVNTTGLLVHSNKAAGRARMEISRYIHNHYGDEKINLVYCSFANPYRPWNSSPAKFYLENDMKETRINSLCELNDTLFDDNSVNLLVIKRMHVKDKNCPVWMNKEKYRFEIQCIPGWIEKIYLLNKNFNDGWITELYRLESDYAAVTDDDHLSSEEIRQ